MSQQIVLKNLHCASFRYKMIQHDTANDEKQDESCFLWR